MKAGSINGLLVILVLFHIFIGCASMDLKVDTLPVSNDYGRLAPRVSADKCAYYVKDNVPDASTYTVLAQYVVQETSTVITARSSQTMICHVYREAIKAGADAIIVDDIGTTGVGGYGRTTPIVKIRAIRFKGDVPKQ